MKSTVEPLIWEGCYESSWKGVINDASFCHPAKYSRDLIERIFQHCLDEGYLRRGDLVGDCFGGIGTGGIAATYAGLRWIGVELEPRFVKLAQANFDLHVSRFRTLDRVPPFIVKGDSRKFDELVSQAHGVVCSPPYAVINVGAGGLNHKPAKKPGQQSGRSATSASQVADPHYGGADGQISNLREGSVDGVVTSPPYADSVNSEQHGIDFSKAKPDYKGRVMHEQRIASHDKRAAEMQYGKTSGQIGALHAGPVDAVITSPPYAESIRGMATCGTDVDKSDRKCGPNSQQALRSDYGDSEGQIGRLRSSPVDAVITSPPYGTREDGGGIAQDGQTNTSPLGRSTLSAVVTSPPWEKNSEGSRKARKFKNPAAVLKCNRGHGASDAAVLAQAARDEQKVYGDSEGQIGQLKGGNVDGIVTSPPYAANEKSDYLRSADGKTRARDEKRGFKQGHGSFRGSEGYGDTKGQIGRERPETYWEAMREVYASCFRAIKPGGVICCVVKDYVKGGKRVPLCDDTARLLEHCGFVVIERIHAMLVHETEHNDLFNGATRTKKSRKSFFRRLAEKNGSPEINYEEVVVARKP